MQHASTTARALKNALVDEIPQMLAMLEELVAVDSGSYDADGVDQVGRRLAEAWAALGFVEEAHPLPARGARRCLSRRMTGRGRLLILGHLDTVWPVGTVAGWGFSRDERFAAGPGVGDMKGGLVMAFFAVRRLLAAGFDGLAEIRHLLVPDEELGSPGSRAWIEEEAQAADWVLVLEPARPGGGVVVRRGAVGALVVEARGRSAHAAVNPQDGASALKALARAVEPLEALSRPADGIVVNVGRLTGGAARQVVPDVAEMHVDLRAASDAESRELLTQVRRILSQPAPGVTLEIHGGITRPAFPRDASTKLYALLEAAASEIGAPLSPVETRGGSDGSFAAALGRPTLDGLGPVCFDTCSRRERIEIVSLAERGALFGALIAGLAPDGEAAAATRERATWA
ncbi:M20 family metallopeptidase [Hypericibacter sp.]|uniref:M20 family metallopeptidase n=1 Tax=Hypericibacter sp. TaxID=2705401 RepID=UPI003D6CCB80